MAIFCESLSEEDITALSAMHQNIGDSFTSALGSRFVRRYWRFIEASPLESTFIHRDPNTNQITSCLVVSFDKPSLLLRVLLGTFPHSFFWLLVRFFISSYLRRLLWAVGKKMIASDEKDDSPEIVFLYTIPEARNQTIARKLLQQAESHALKKGFNVIHTQTVQTPIKESIHFYEKHGYATYRTSNLGVFQLTALKKTLHQ